MTEYCDVSPDCYSAVEYRAKKEYRCCECRIPIEPSEKYLYCFGVWEGSPNTYRQHIACAEACEFFRDQINDGDCLPFGDLIGQSREYIRMLGMEHKHNDNIASWRKMLADILRRKKAWGRGEDPRRNMDKTKIVNGL